MADRPRPQTRKRTAKEAGEPIVAAKSTPQTTPQTTPQVPSKPPPTDGDRKAAVAVPASHLATRIAGLEAERDGLATALAAAKAQIAALEAARDQVLNRIDWVIDSLHSLSRDSGDSGC